MSASGYSVDSRTETVFTQTMTTNPPIHLQTGSSTVRCGACMWVADSFDGLGADIWFEGGNGSHLAGERTLVWRNVRYDWARALVAAWNDEATRLGGGP